MLDEWFRWSSQHECICSRMRGFTIIAGLILSLLATSSLQAQNSGGDDTKKVVSHLRVEKGTTAAPVANEPQLQKQPLDRLQVVPDDGIPDKEKQERITNPKLLGETQQHLRVVKPNDK